LHLLGWKNFFLVGLGGLRVFGAFFAFFLIIQTGLVIQFCCPPQNMAFFFPSMIFLERDVYQPSATYQYSN